MTNALATKKLQEYAERGDLDGVRAAIQAGAEPLDMDSYALRFAAFHGHLDIVKLLLPVSDPKAAKSWALRGAAHFGYLAIVKFLIPVSDSKANGSLALVQALVGRHGDCVEALLPHSDTRLVKKRLMDDGGDEALLLLDAVMQATDLKAKHARAPTADSQAYSLAL